MYEITRYETYPFIIGMAAVLGMGIFINLSITEEDKKSSKYYKQFILGDRSGH